MLEPSQKTRRNFWSIETSEFSVPLCRTSWSAPLYRELESYNKYTHSSNTNRITRSIYASNIEILDASNIEILEGKRKVKREKSIKIKYFHFFSLLLLVSRYMPYVSWHVYPANYLHEYLVLCYHGHISLVRYLSVPASIPSLSLSPAT